MSFSCFWKLQFSIYTSFFDELYINFPGIFICIEALLYNVAQSFFSIFNDMGFVLLRVVAFRIVGFYEAFLQFSAGLGTNYDNCQPVDFFFLLVSYSYFPYYGLNKSIDCVL